MSRSRYHIPDPLFVFQQQGLLLQLLRLAAKYRVQQSLNSPTKPVALRRARSFDMNSTQPGFDSGATSVAASHSRRMIVNGVERLREGQNEVSGKTAAPSSLGRTPADVVRRD